MTEPTKPKAKAKPFWQTKSLEEMTRKEWESLCDGCGRCCLNKYEDADTGRIAYTDVACKLLDLKSCQCSDYKNRTKLVPDCIVLTPAQVSEMNCLPPTCAYRLVEEGKDLYWWHPLVSGRRESVIESGIAVKGRIISEKGLTEDEIAARIVRWPMTSKANAQPKQAKSAKPQAHVKT